MNPVSPKATWAAAAAALSSIFWGIAGATFWKDTFDDALLVTLTTATTMVLVFLGAYRGVIGSKYMSWRSSEDEQNTAKVQKEREAELESALQHVLDKELEPAIEKAIEKDFVMLRRT